MPIMLKTDDEHEVMAAVKEAIPDDDRVLVRLRTVRRADTMRYSGRCAAIQISSARWNCQGMRRVSVKQKGDYNTRTYEIDRGDLIAKVTEIAEATRKFEERERADKVADEDRDLRKREAMDAMRVSESGEPSRTRVQDFRLAGGDVSLGVYLTFTGTQEQVRQALDKLEELKYLTK